MSVPGTWYSSESWVLVALRVGLAGVVVVSSLSLINSWSYVSGETCERWVLDLA